MKKDNKIPVFHQYQTVSPATKLLQKRRKMYQIHEQFENQKHQFRQQQEKFKDEQKNIEEQDQKLQNQLIFFCQYLQENQSKRKKAQQRYNLEVKAFKEKEEQISNLQRQIDELTRSQKKYLNRVGHLRKYEQYLQKVRTNYSDQYPEMNDILNRFQTLKKSNDDLIKTREVMEANHEILKRQTLSEEKQLNQLILTINNELKELSRKIEDRTNQKNELQSEVQKSNEDFSNKNLNLGKIFMAIDNLNYRCNQNSYKVKYEFDDKGSIQKKEVKIKKIQQPNSAKQEEENSYEQRSKQAALKLKNILSHMKDFKAIIDQYKTQYRHIKEKP